MKFIYWKSTLNSANTLLLSNGKSLEILKSLGLGSSGEELNKLRAANATSQLSLKAFDRNVKSTTA